MERGAVFVSDADNTIHCDNHEAQGPAPSLCEDDVEEDTLKAVHKEKDFISLLSSTPGEYAVACNYN